MHCSDLCLSLSCPLLIINPSQLLPFGPAIRPHAVTAKAKGGWGRVGWGGVQKAGRDRVEVSIHLRGKGLVLSTEARLV